MFGLNMIDLSCIAVLFVFVILGFSKGFLKVALEVLSMLLGGLVASVLTKPIVHSIYSVLDIRNKLSSGISDAMVPIMNRSLQGKEVSIGFTKAINNALEGFGSFQETLSKALYSNDSFVKLLQDAKLGMQDAVVKGVVDIIEPIILSMLFLLVFVILFALVRIVLVILLKPIIGIISRLPIIGVADKVLGGLSGALWGASWVAVLLVVFTVVLKVSGSPANLDLLAGSKLMTFVSSFITR